MKLAVVAIDNRSTRRPVGVAGGGVSRDPNGFSMRPLKMAVFPAKGTFSWARESALTDSVTVTAWVVVPNRRGRSNRTFRFTLRSRCEQESSMMVTLDHQAA